jgi:hypothetical protein
MRLQQPAGAQQDVASKKGSPMAIGWLSVLQMVPWSDVIHNAPKVAESAKALWKTVAGQPPAQEVVDDSAGAPARLPEAQVITQLQAQLAATEATVASLHQQMLASSELIQSMAEQNTQLIRQVDALRIRVRWLAGAAAVAGGLALLALGMGLR